MCSSQVVEGKTGENGQHKCACSQPVELGAARDSRELLTIGQRRVVSAPAQAAEGNSLTACCSGGFSGANDSALDVTLVEAETKQFGLVQRPSVVSAGACCDPAVDLLVANEEGQAVLDLERLNGIPTNGYGLEGIHHGDALVSDNQLWAHEEQPGADASCCTPNPGAKVVPFGRNHDAANQENNCCQSDAAPWPENLRVTHASIIAGEN